MTKFVDKKTYIQIDQLLILLDSFAVSMYHDYNLLSEEEREKTYKQQLTATRALREITGLNAHKAEVEEMLKQEQLRVMEENSEYIEDFASTISQELTSIQNPSCTRHYELNKEATSTEDLFNVSIDCTPMPPVKEPTYPNATKEEWLVAIENAKKRLQEEYDNAKKFNDPNSKENETFAKAFGLPHNHFFSPVVLKEVFVDEDVLASTKGFMLGPVGMFNSKVVEASIQKYDSLAEMVIFLRVQAKTKDIVIYHTFKERDKYYFRGAFVDKID